MVNKITKIIHNKIFTGTITLILAIEIFLFSTIKTTAGAIPSGLNLATFYHFGIFFLFTFFLFMTVKPQDKIKTEHIVLTLIISLIYATSDEFHQLFVPGRMFSITDIVTDLMGSIVAILIYPKRKF